MVGWWSGYKLGGVLSLFSAEFLENAGFENYWQLTFLILGILIILMNIGLMFIHETGHEDRRIKQLENDKLISTNIGGRLPKKMNLAAICEPKHDPCP